MNELFPKPVILCIGTVNVTGDSLGPKVGDLLIDLYDIDAYVYGTSSRPVNGVNYQKYVDHVRTHHSDDIVIAVDACLGDKEDVGKVKYAIKGLKAGAALKKNLSCIGDIGILGVVAERSDNNLKSLIDAEISTVDSVAEKVAKKVYSLVAHLKSNYYSRRIIESIR